MASMATVGFGQRARTVTGHGTAQDERRPTWGTRLDSRGRSLLASLRSRERCEVVSATRRWDGVGMPSPEPPLPRQGTTVQTPHQELQLANQLQTWQILTPRNPKIPGGEQEGWKAAGNQRGEASSKGVSKIHPPRCRVSRPPTGPGFQPERSGFHAVLGTTSVPQHEESQSSTSKTPKSCFTAAGPQNRRGFPFPPSHIPTTEGLD